MKLTTRMKERFDAASGKAGWLLLWLLGVPIPILLVLFLMRGCTLMSSVPS